MCSVCLNKITTIRCFFLQNNQSKVKLNKVIKEKLCINFEAPAVVYEALTSADEKL